MKFTFKHPSFNPGLVLLILANRLVICLFHHLSEDDFSQDTKIKIEIVTFSMVSTGCPSKLTRNIKLFYFACHTNN